MSRYHFSTGGKRVRALIPCWVYAAYGKDPLTAVRLGCAIEMIHNATLVHDDLQDGDTVRRGMPTVWAKYSKPQAINCGDALFQFAFEMLCELDLKAETARRVSRLATRATLLVIEGQAQEFLMKDERFPSVERYLGVVRGKTAALLASAVRMSMEALGISPDICERAEGAALQAGILFQIQDDLLDIYGEKDRDRHATDIAEGKISFLIALINEKASSADRSRVSQILRTPREQTSETQIDEVLGIFERYDVKSAALRRIRELQEAIHSDSLLAQHNEIHTLLMEMIRHFLKPIEHLL